MGIRGTYEIQGIQSRTRVIMAKRTELCPVETTARIVAGRWKAAVLEHSSEALSDFPK